MRKRKAAKQRFCECGYASEGCGIVTAKTKLRSSGFANMDMHPQDAE